MSPGTDRTIRSEVDGGEGVMSSVIAVLIMVLLGAAMWLTFENIWSDGAANTESKGELIDSEANRPAGG